MQRDKAAGRRRLASMALLIMFSLFMHAMLTTMFSFDAAAKLTEKMFRENKGNYSLLAL